MDKHDILKNIKQHNILSKEEVLRLFEYKPEGWKEQVFLSNIRLVVSRLSKRKNFIPFEDAFQSGCIGLLEAIEKFDYTLGNSFTTYAVWWIKHHVLRAEDEEGRTIRVPSYINQILINIRKDPKGFEERINDLNKKDNLTEWENSLVQGYKYALGYSEPSSYDKSVGDDLYMLECIPDKSQNKSDYSFLEDALVELKDKERFIIYQRFFNERTLEDIGVDLNVSRERVRQIEKSSLIKLRKILKGYERYYN